MDGNQQSKLIQIDTYSFKQMLQVYVQKRATYSKFKSKTQRVDILHSIIRKMCQKHKLRAEMNVVIKICSFSRLFARKFDFSLVTGSNDPFDEISSRIY